MKAALTIIGAITLVLAACTTSNTIDGHQVHGTAEAPVLVATDLHASAPQWFKDRWRRYLEVSDGSYAVLAADRNGRGTGYVYCDPGSGGLCDSHRRWTAAFK